MWQAALANGQRDQSTGLFVRDRYDCGIILQQQGWAQVKEFGIRGGVVLDLGAHIGAATYYLRQWVVPELVVAVEADPANAAAFRRNWDTHRDVVLYEAAVTDAPVLAAHIWRHQRYTSCTTIERRSGREPAAQVETLRFGSLVQQYRPAVIKCDIEASEYSLHWRALEQVPQCRAVLLEAHFTRKQHHAQFAQMHEHLTTMGFMPSAGWTLPARGRAAIVNYSRG